MGPTRSALFLFMTKRIFGILTILALCLFSFYPVKNVQAANPVIPWPAPPYNSVNVNFSTSGNQTIVAAPSAYATCIYGLTFVNAGATGTTITIYQDGGTTAVSSVYLVSGGGSASWLLNMTNPKAPYFITNVQTAFVVNSSGATQINGSVYAASCP